MGCARGTHRAHTVRVVDGSRPTCRSRGNDTAAESVARTLLRKTRMERASVFPHEAGEARPGRRSLDVRLVLAMSVVILLPVARGDGHCLEASASFLETHFLVTWYGNPHTAAMGVLGQSAGTERALALQRQAAAYAPLTSKPVVAAYHLVAVVAQPAAGASGTWRRRESPEVIRAVLEDARARGFLLVLDIQPGRSNIEEELEYLRPFLSEPDVHLALDPEFDVGEGQAPGTQLGHMHAADVNAALDFLECAIVAGKLPPKVLIVHQFTLGMLPDKDRIRGSASVDVVLDMDGFGTQALKRATYAAIHRQRRLAFSGIKLFYRQDTDVLSPEQVMELDPVPALVVYQ